MGVSVVDRPSDADKIANGLSDALAAVKGSSA